MLALARIDRTRQAVARARAAGHVPRPMPAQASPLAAERSYATRLRSLVDRAITDAYAPLLRELPGLVDRSRSERGDAADWRIDGTNSGRSASAAVKVAATSARQGLAAPAIRGAASGAAGDAHAHVAGQLGKQVREVLGIDLAADTRAKARTAAFIHENVKLITGIGPTLAADIERTILSGLTAGQLHETLALAIKSRMQVAINRAELIAVDQLGKIVGQINAARQQDLGVTHFYWRSAEDERVRGNPNGLYPKATPSHYDRNGKRYAYADPPKGKKGERELPGVPIRCRCGAEPDLSTVLGEGPAAPAPRDPTAPDAPNRAPTVEEQEAEAERLRREVEAMLAGQAAPTPAPTPTPPTVLREVPPSPQGRLVTIPAPATMLPGAGAARIKANTDAALATIPESRKTWDAYAKANPDGSGSTEIKPGFSISPRDFARERAAFASALTPEELTACVFYSHNGNNVINGAIRDGRVGQDPRTEQMVRDLDAAIAKNAVAADTLVMRGLNGDWAFKLYTTLTVGDAFVEPGYSSTSATTPFGATTRLNIRIPAGAAAAPIPTRYPDENEYLLPRGARFIVTGKSVGASGQLQIDLDVVL